MCAPRIPEGCRRVVGGEHAKARATTGIRPSHPPTSAGRRAPNASIDQNRKVDLLRENKLISTINLSKYEQINILKEEADCVYLTISSSLTGQMSNLVAVKAAGNEISYAFENKRQEFKTAEGDTLVIPQERLQLILK